jgi:hypothetical protein
MAQVELSLTDAVHQLNAGDRDRRVAELLEPQHHSDTLRWSCSIRLLRYYDDRSLVSFGREPSVLARVTRGGTQRSRPA